MRFVGVFIVSDHRVSPRRIGFAKTRNELDSQPPEDVIHQAFGHRDIGIRSPATGLEPRVREFFDQDFDRDAVLQAHRCLGSDDVHQTADGASFLGHVDEQLARSPVFEQANRDIAFMTTAVLVRAQEFAPDNPDLLLQLSNVDNNNGHVLETRGDIDAAAANYRRMLNAAQRLAALGPDNTEWQKQLGLAHNNLAKMALLHGDLRAAIEGYRADMDIEAKAAARDPRNNQQRERLLIAKGALGRTLAMTGELDEGTALLRQALDDARKLQAFEPDNTSFQEDVGLYSVQLARLLRLRGDTAGAASLAAQSKAIFEKLVATDSPQPAWRREHAETLTELAAQAVANGDRGKATSLLDKALAILEPQLDGSTQDRATVIATVDAWLRMTTLSPAAERSALAQRALAITGAQTSGQSDPRLQALRVEALLLLGREPEARALGEKLVASGYRDATLMDLLHASDIASNR